MSFQTIFAGLAKVTIMFLGSNNGRNTHIELPIQCSWGYKNRSCWRGVGDMCCHLMRYGPRVDYDHAIGLIGPEYRRGKCQRASLRPYCLLDIGGGGGHAFYSK